MPPYLTEMACCRLFLYTCWETFAILHSCAVVHSSTVGGSDLQNLTAIGQKSSIFNVRCDRYPFLLMTMLYYLLLVWFSDRRARLQALKPFVLGVLSLKENKKLDLQLIFQILVGCRHCGQTSDTAISLAYSLSSESVSYFFLHLHFNDQLTLFTLLACVDILLPCPTLTLDEFVCTERLLFTASLHRTPIFIIFACVTNVDFCFSPHHLQSVNPFQHTAPTQTEILAHLLSCPAGRHFWQHFHCFWIVGKRCITIVTHWWSLCTSCQY